MKQYRKKLKLQIMVSAILILLAALLQILLATGQINPTTLNEHWKEFYSGLITGISIAIEVMGLVRIIQLSISLKDEKKLRKHYILNHDERNLAIAAKSDVVSFNFYSIGLMVAAIIGGYFNIIIALTCVSVLVYIALVRVSLNIYYTNKM